MTVTLVRFACTKCGRTVEALPTATVEHRCPNNHNRVTKMVAAS